jgi:hypothetical protein
MIYAVGSLIGRLQKKQDSHFFEYKTKIIFSARSILKNEEES